MLVPFRKVVDSDTGCAYKSSEDKGFDDFSSRFDEMEDPGVETRAVVILFVLLALMLVSLMRVLVLEPVVVLLFERQMVLVQGEDATDSR